jgi:hypothetical protein
MYNMVLVSIRWIKEKIGLLYRKQWVEIEDAPTTGFSSQSSYWKKCRTRISAITDKINGQ